MSTDQRQREDAKGQAPVQVVQKKRAGQNKGADEEKDQRVSERQEDLFGRGDLEQDAGRSADERREWQRDRFRDPEDDDSGKDCREAVGLRLEGFERQ